VTKIRRHTACQHGPHGAISQLYQQPVDVVLRLTFIRKLCYKLPSVITFIFIQTFDQKFVFFTEQRAPKLARLLDTASKFALFSVSDLKDEKLIKKQTYMKTEACELYSRVFWTFKLNFIKIDPYNFELYRFKVGGFFETQCNTVVRRFKRQYCASIILIVHFTPSLCKRHKLVNNSSTGMRCVVFNRRY